MNEFTIRVEINGGRKFFRTFEEAQNFCKKNKGARIDATKTKDGDWV